MGCHLVILGCNTASAKALRSIQQRSHMVVEGAAAARSVSELARELGVDAPLTFALERTLYHGGTLAEALELLTDRFPTQEFYGMDD